MPNDGRSDSSVERQLWEALFSLHLAFLGVSMGILEAMFGRSGIDVDVLLAHMEVRINGFLHIRQTDYIRGYFSVWIPSLLIACLLWAVLRACARTRIARKFLRSAAGVTTVLAPPAYWVMLYERTTWPAGWPYRGIPFELATALVFALLFLLGKWKAPCWASLLLLAEHYVYWYFTPDSFSFYPNYQGPAGPILGFCAAAAWGFHISRLRKDGALGAPVPA